MTTPLDDILAGLESDSLRLVDRIEGSKDLLSTNIERASLDSIGDWKSRMEQRRALIQKLIDAARALLADGWPTDPLPTFSPEIAREIAEQKRTVDLAADFFTAPRPAAVATAAGLVPKTEGVSFKTTVR